MKHRKNILIITSWYPQNSSDFSGIFIKEQVEILKEKFNLIVVHPIIDYASFSPFFVSTVQRSEENNVPIIRIRVKRSFPIYNQWNFLVTAKKAIKKELQNKKIDLIHCHISYPAGVLGMMLANDLKVPFVITEHYGGFVGLFRSAIHKYLILRAINKAVYLSTVSDFSANIIRNYTTTPIEIIPNPIDVTKFSVKKEPRQNHTAITAGFLGGLDSNVKGLDLLLKALNILKPSGLKVKIGGSGKLIETYKALAEKLNVENYCLFLGAIPAEKRFEFFDDLDFFVLSSRRESFGVVLLEAMASGVPVLATRCGGPEEIVEKQTGILVENENANALANGLREMMHRYTLFDPLQIRNRVKARFGKDVFLKRMEIFYNKVTDRNVKK